MRNLTRHGMCALFGLAVMGVILPAAARPALARDIWYVDAAAESDGDGTNWGSPFKHLQCALAAASDGDEIRVAGGTYYPDDGEGLTPGEQTLSFSILNDMKLKGGYEGISGLPGGTENDRTETSILSGDIATPSGPSSSDSQNVVTVFNNTLATVLDRFTVRSGYADGSNLKQHGGGMIIHNSPDVEVTDCTFEDNFATNQGGAVYVSLVATPSQTTFEDCLFNDNESNNSGGGISASQVGENDGHNFTVTDTDFNRNNALVAATGGAQGGAMSIRRADQVVITDCNFNDNFAALYGGALELRVSSDDLEIVNAVATITRCTFTGNGHKVTDGPDLFTGTGGAVWIANTRKTDFVDCTFTDNTCVGGGGGAVWAAAFAGDDQEGGALDVEINLDGCTFLRNDMTNEASSSGGGGLWVDARPVIDQGDARGVIHGTWTDCTFIENTAPRGGAIYVHGSDRIDIENCLFIANVGTKAGGGIGIGDPDDFGTVKIYICKSQFISNTSARGGAVHNHEGAVTYMVNCIVAGNSSTKEGGGVFNSQHTGSNPAEIYMHNCLIAGNVADGPDSDDMGGGVFSGLNITGFLDDPGVMELIQCTLLGNHAGYKYGGAIDASKNSTLRFYNSISRGNTSVSESDTFKNQLFHIEVAGVGYAAGDVSNFVADGTLPTAVYDDSPTWTGDDPDFLDEGSTRLAWDESAYDTTLGLTTFTLDDAGTAAAGMLFKPDPNEYAMLLIKQVNFSIPGGGDEVVCYGKWANSTPDPAINGKLFDLHIDDTGSAYNFGNSTYYPDDDDVCDLDPVNPLLEVDLDLVARTGNPDCGAYEDN